MGDSVVGGTLPPATENTVTEAVTTVATSNVVVIARTIILILFLLFSLIGNSILVLSVAQSSKNRINPFNAFVLSMASYGLLECALTMSLATGFSVERTWMFGDFLTGFNASFIQLQNVGIFLTITAMSIDRYIAVTRLTKYHTHSSVHHANYIVLYTWLHAFIFSLPLLFQNQMLGVVCRPFSERCLCGLVEGTSTAFTVAMTILCFFIPFVLIILFLYMVSAKASEERKRVKSLNTHEYATYCMQESLLLNEARLRRYVILLFLTYLTFKGPYVMLDILTQLNVSFVYQPVTVGNITVEVDGSKFYYQTALSWMMFFFSGIFPIITFLQFPDHWRRLKKWGKCGNTTISLASNQRGSVTQRNLRHRRRQRQLQRRNNPNYRNRHQKRNPSLGTTRSHEKVPVSISSNITSEKVPVNGNANKGEVLFRVPVLYATTDGLHLVASEKTINKIRPNNNKKRKKTSFVESSMSSNNNNNSSDGDVVPNLYPDKAVAHHQSKIGQPSGDILDDLRPSSVVDKRVDVTGSQSCLQVEEEVSYMNLDFDGDEDTESELNTSANSRTLIWPHERSTSANSVLAAEFPKRPPIAVWSNGITRPVSANTTCSEFPHSRNFQSGHLTRKASDECTHPHTPSPPPVEDDIPVPLSKHSYIDYDTDLDGGLVDRDAPVKIRLPKLQSKSVVTSFTRQFRPVSQYSSSSMRDELLITDTSDEHPSGIHNDGYESPSAIFSRRDSDVSFVVKQASLNNHSNNKIHPNARKTFVSEARDISPVNQSSQLTISKLSASRASLQRNNVGESLHTTSADNVSSSSGPYEHSNHGKRENRNLGTSKPLTHIIAGR